MSIGLYDADMAKYILVPPNLELMKISAYYKNRGKIVVMSPDFTPERHRRFFFRKDYEDGDYPENLTQPNVNFGGLAFSNNKYCPLPLEVEVLQPDTSIYERYEQQILKKSGGKKAYQNLITGEHCRISLDGKTIWKDYGAQFKNLKLARNLIFYDYDLNKIEGGFDEVQKILQRARRDGCATRVGMKFPVQVNNGEDLLKWSSLRTNSTYFSLQYDGVIDDETFMKWLKCCHERAVYKQMDYYITRGPYGQNEFVMKILPKIFKQVVISRSYYTFFSLKYDEGFFTDKRWEAVIQLFNFYMNSYANVPKDVFIKKIPRDTLYDFAVSTKDADLWKYQGKCYTQDEIRQIFSFVRYYNYSLFTDFYECTAESLGGKVND